MRHARSNGGFTVRSEPVSATATRATVLDLTLIGRYYERFADHAVSVARRVVYLVTGEYDAEVSYDHEEAEDADVIAELERNS